MVFLQLLHTVSTFVERPDQGSFHFQSEHRVLAAQEIELMSRYVAYTIIHKNIQSCRMAKVPEQTCFLDIFGVFKQTYDFRKKFFHSLAVLCICRWSYTGEFFPFQGPFKARFDLGKKNFKFSRPSLAKNHNTAGGEMIGWCMCYIAVFEVLFNLIIYSNRALQFNFSR